MAQHIFEEYLKIPTIDIPYGDLTEEEKTQAKDILIYVFGEELQRQFNSVVKARCEGCRTNHPSQHNHYWCLWLEDDDCEVDSILKKALAKVDISYVKALYLESADILHLDVKRQPNLFDQQVHNFKDQWEQLRYFGVVVTAIRNMNFGQITNLQPLMEAVNSARVKLSSQINLDPRSYLRKIPIFKQT